VKVCAFDLGHTLINDSAIARRSIEATAGWLKGRGILQDEGRFLSTYIEVNRSFDEPYFSRTYGELDFFDQTFEKLDLDRKIVSPASVLAEYRKILMSEMTIDDDTIAGLRFAKASGYRLAIISNERVKRVEETVRKFGLDELFETVVVSEGVGSEKPDLGIFRETLKRLNVAGQDVIMFGDNLVADGACKQLGMLFVYVSTYKNMYEKHSSGAQPDYDIGRISEDTMRELFSSHALHERTRHG
jgi:HAD superfamily hydrolase (TIGR01549 family)